MKNFRIFIGAVTAALIGTNAFADVCDYRPSEAVSGFGAGMMTGAAAATSATGAALQSAGFYTLVHAGSGLTMLASTAGGVSAAGTIGIMGGTGGAVGTAAAFLMSPVVVVGGAIVAVGTVGFESACYAFHDEKQTEYDDVFAALNVLVDPSEDTFRLVDASPGMHSAQFSIRDELGEWHTYQVADLYIVNGELRWDRFGPANKRLGQLIFMQPEVDDQPSAM